MSRLQLAWRTRRANSHKKHKNNPLRSGGDGRKYSVDAAKLYCFVEQTLVVKGRECRHRSIGLTYSDGRCRKY